MKHKRLDNFLSKNSSKEDLKGQIIVGTILLSTLMSIFVFYPISIYINPYVYNNPEPYINTEHLRLKGIVNIQTKGIPKLGFNTLEVMWPVGLIAVMPI
jgi:hypothetical protein